MTISAAPNGRGGGGKTIEDDEDDDDDGSTAERMRGVWVEKKKELHENDSQNG